MVSPFFRTLELLACHRTLTEAPWTEIWSFTLGFGPIPESERVQVGTFICLFDKELKHRSEEIDVPEFYGQVKKLVRYDGQYALAVVTIMAFY